MSDAATHLRVLLDAGQTIELRVDGTSMRPWLRAGERVTVARRPIRFGDLIAYPRDGGIVVHRVIGRHGDAWRVQGDGTRRREPTVDDPLGRVIAVDGRHRFGLGPERRLIALLSRSGLLRPVLALVVKLRPRRATDLEPTDAKDPTS
ncbi:MAG: S24/S26 family peptidase [Acidobacteriota bacterium]